METYYTESTPSQLDKQSPKSPPCSPNSTKKKKPMHAKLKMLESEKFKEQLFDEVDGETLESLPILRTQFKEAQNCSLRPEDFKENPQIDYETKCW